MQSMTGTVRVTPDDWTGAADWVDALNNSADRYGRGAYTQLARQIDVPGPYISRWTRRDSHPSSKFWRRIEDATGMRPGTIAAGRPVDLTTERRKWAPLMSLVFDVHEERCGPNKGTFDVVQRMVADHLADKPDLQEQLDRLTPETVPILDEYKMLPEEQAIRYSVLRERDEITWPIWTTYQDLVFSWLRGRAEPRPALWPMIAEVSGICISELEAASDADDDAFWDRAPDDELRAVGRLDEVFRRYG